ncbi:MAG: SH3 domain-containing protein [Anaerolineae bacterium]|nr:SH3 domain-containing protein [Anaerolineae bacterium]
MNPLNENTLFLFVGLIGLLVSVAFSAVRLRQGRLRADVFNVLIVLAACVLIGIGMTRIAFAAQPGAPVSQGKSAAVSSGSDSAAADMPVRAELPGNGVARGNVVGDSTPTASTPQATVDIVAEATALQQGTLPPRIMTAIAKGGAAAAPNGNGSNPSSGSNAPTGQNGIGANAAGGAPAGFPMNQFASLVTAVVAVIAIAGGFLIFRTERTRPDFEPAASPGLLNMGAGAFALVAALVIPIIPAQLAGGASGGAFAAQVTPSQVAIRVAQQSSTPTVTLTPSSTVTPLPSLTPTPSETPIVLYTPVPYTGTNGDLSTPTACTVVAQTMLNLRGDPSVDQRAIGRVFAGTLLPVTGQSADKKWWRVQHTANGVTVEGWVSAEFARADSACTPGSVPVIKPGEQAPAQTATQALAPTATQGRPTATIPANSGPCILTTTQVASLRSGPARSYLIIGQIPERTPLSATQKSSDGQWWNISYEAPDGTTQTGWVGSGVVFASAACSALPAVTVTPTP